MITSIQKASDIIRLAQKAQSSDAFSQVLFEGYLPSILGKTLVNRNSLEGRVSKWMFGPNRALYTQKICQDILRRAYADAFQGIDISTRLRIHEVIPFTKKVVDPSFTVSAKSQEVDCLKQRYKYRKKKEEEQKKAELYTNSILQTESPLKPIGPEAFQALWGDHPIACDEAFLYCEEFLHQSHPEFKKRIALLKQARKYKQEAETKIQQAFHSSFHPKAFEEIANQLHQDIHGLQPCNTHFYLSQYQNILRPLKQLLRLFFKSFRLDTTEFDSRVGSLENPQILVEKCLAKIKGVLRETFVDIELPEKASVLFSNQKRKIPGPIRDYLPEILCEWIDQHLQKGLLSLLQNPHAELVHGDLFSFPTLQTLLSQEKREKALDEIVQQLKQHVKKGSLAIFDLQYLMGTLLHYLHTLPQIAQDLIEAQDMISHAPLHFSFTKEADGSFTVALYSLGQSLSYLEGAPVIYKGVPKEALNKDFCLRLIEQQFLQDTRKEDVVEGLLKALEIQSSSVEKKPVTPMHRKSFTEVQLFLAVTLDELFPEVEKRIRLQALIDFCQPFLADNECFPEEHVEVLKRILPQISTLAKEFANADEQEEILRIKDHLQSILFLSNSHIDSITNLDFSQMPDSAEAVSALKSSLTGILGEKASSLFNISPETTSVEESSAETLWDVLSHAYTMLLCYLYEAALFSIACIFPSWRALPILSFLHFFGKKHLKPLNTFESSTIKRTCLIGMSCFMNGVSPFFLWQVLRLLPLELLLPEPAAKWYQENVDFLQTEITNYVYELLLNVIFNPQAKAQFKQTIEQIKQRVTGIINSFKQEKLLSWTNPLLTVEQLEKQAPLLGKDVLHHTVCFSPIDSLTRPSHPYPIFFPSDEPFSKENLAHELTTWQKDFVICLKKGRPQLAFTYFYEQALRLVLPHKDPSFWQNLPNKQEVLDQLYETHATLHEAFREATPLEDSPQNFPFSFPWFRENIIQQQIALSSLTLFVCIQHLVQIEENHPFGRRIHPDVYKTLCWRFLQTDPKMFEQSKELLSFFTRQSYEALNPQHVRGTLSSLHRPMKELPELLRERLHSLNPQNSCLTQYCKQLLQDPQTKEKLKNVGVDLSLEEEELVNVLLHEILLTFRDDKTSPIPKNIRYLFFHELMNTNLSHRIMHGIFSLPTVSLEYIRYMQSYRYKELPSKPDSLWGKIKQTLKKLILDPLCLERNISFLTSFFSSSTKWTSHAYRYYSVESVRMPESISALKRLEHPIEQDQQQSIIHAEETRINLKNPHDSTEEFFELNSIFPYLETQILQMIGFFSSHKDCLIDECYVNKGRYSTKNKGQYSKIGVFSLIRDAFFTQNALSLFLHETPHLVPKIIEFFEESLAFTRDHHDLIGYCNLIEIGMQVEKFCGNDLGARFPNWEEKLQDLPSVSSKAPSDYQISLEKEGQTRKLLLLAELAEARFQKGTGSMLQMMETSLQACLYLKIHNPRLYFGFYECKKESIRHLLVRFWKYEKEFLALYEEQMKSKEFHRRLLSAVGLLQTPTDAFSLKTLSTYQTLFGHFLFDFEKQTLHRIDGFPLVQTEAKVIFQEKIPGYFVSTDNRWSMSEDKIRLHQGGKTYTYVEAKHLHRSVQGLLPNSSQQLTFWIEETDHTKKRLIVHSHLEPLLELTIIERDKSYYLHAIHEQKPLIYTDSNLWENALSPLGAFCPLKDMLCFVDEEDPTQLQKLIFVPFSLSFSLRQGKMECEQHPGFFLSPNQTLSDLSLESSLKLENKEGTTKILLPRKHSLALHTQAFLRQLSLLALCKQLGAKDFVSSLSVNSTKFLETSSDKSLLSSHELDTLVALFNLLCALPEQLNPKSYTPLSDKERWHLIEASIHTLIDKMTLNPKTDHESSSKTTARSILQAIPKECFLFFLGYSKEQLIAYQRLKEQFSPHSFIIPDMMIKHGQKAVEVTNYLLQMHLLAPHFHRLFENIVTQCQDLTLIKDKKEAFTKMFEQYGTSQAQIIDRLSRLFKKDHIHSFSVLSNELSFYEKLFQACNQPQAEKVGEETIPLTKDFVQNHLFSHGLLLYAIAKGEKGDLQKKQLKIQLHLLKGGWDLASRQWIDLLLEVASHPTPYFLPSVEDFLSNLKQAQKYLQDLEEKVHSKEKPQEALTPTETQPAITEQKPSLPSEEPLPNILEKLPTPEEKKSFFPPEKKIEKNEKPFHIPFYDSRQQYYEIIKENGNYRSSDSAALLLVLSLYLIQGNTEKAEALFPTFAAQVRLSSFDPKLLEHAKMLIPPSLISKKALHLRLKVEALLVERQLLAKTELDSPKKIERSREKRLLSSESIRQPIQPLQQKKPDPSTPQQKRYLQMVQAKQSHQLAIKKQHSASKSQSAFLNKKLSSAENQPSPDQVFTSFLDNIRSSCFRFWLLKLAGTAGFVSVGKLLSHSCVSLLKTQLSAPVQCLSALAYKATPVLPKDFELPSFFSADSSQEIEPSFTSSHASLSPAKDLEKHCTRLLHLIRDHLFVKKPQVFHSSSDWQTTLMQNLGREQELQSSLEAFHSMEIDASSFERKDDQSMWEGYALLQSLEQMIKEVLSQEDQTLLSLAKEQIHPEITRHNLLDLYLKETSPFSLPASFSHETFSTLMERLLVLQSWKEKCVLMRKSFTTWINKPNPQTWEMLETSTQERQYDLEDFPPQVRKFLINMEKTGQFFWRAQIDVLKRTFSTEGAHACIQLLMGMGKSAKIFPALNGALNENNEQLSINIFPKALIGPAQSHLAKSLSLSQQALSGSINIDRNEPVSLAKVKALLALCKECITQRESLVFTQESLQALELTFLETLQKVEKDSSLIPVLQIYQQIFLLLRKHGIAIADEAHKVFDVQKELIFPVGAHSHYPKEYFMPCKRLFFLYLEKDPDFLRFIQQNNLTSYPPEQFSAHIETCLNTIGQQDFHLSGDLLENWIAFAKQNAEASPELQSHPDFTSMCLYKGYLTIFPSLFTSSYGVSFARSKKDPSTLFAKPAQNTVIKEEAELQNLEETLLKTTIMYLITGIPENLFWPLIQEIYAEALKRTLDGTVCLEDTEEYQLFNQEEGISARELFEAAERSSSEERSRLFALCKHRPNFVFAFVEKRVIQQLHFFSKYLKSTPYDFASLFRKIKTMTGTPYNHSFYPSHIPVFNEETDGKAVEAVAQNLAKDPMISIQDGDVHQLLSQLLEKMQEKSCVRALIDTAALLRGLSNEQVAQEIFSMLKQQQTSFDGVIFYKEDAQGLDVPYVLEAKYEKVLPLSQAQVRPERCFLYFSAAQCFGADLPFPDHCAIFLTFDEVTTFNTLMQGAFRLRALRDLKTGWQIYFAMKKSEQVDTYEKLIQKAIQREEQILRERALQAYLMQIKNVIRSTVIEKILRISVVEAFQMLKEFSSLFFSEVSLDPVQKYGAASLLTDAQEFLEREKEKALKMLLPAYFTEEEREKAREDIESLARPFLPEQICVPQEQSIGAEVQVETQTEQEQTQEVDITVEQNQQLHSPAIPRHHYEPFAWPKIENAAAFIPEEHFQPVIKGQRLHWYSPLDWKKLWDQCPLFSLCSILQEAELPSLRSLAPYFSDKIWVSNNFIPTYLKSDDLNHVELGSIAQRTAYEVIVHAEKQEDGSFTITSVGCLSMKDAFLWRKQIQKTPRSKNRIVFLYHLQNDCPTVGAIEEAMRLQEEGKLLPFVTMLRFLNGDLAFANFDALQNWITPNPALFQGAFLDIRNGRRYNKERTKAAQRNPHHPLFSQHHPLSKTSTDAPSEEETIWI